MEKNWILKSQDEGEVVDRIAVDLDIVKPLATLLVQRGVTSFDEAKSFNSVRGALFNCFNP